MNNMRKHFRLTEEFTYGTLLIQSAYLPVGQTPADGDWETEHTYDWDSPQETLRSLLSAMSDFAGALAGAQTANIEYASKIVTLNKQLEALEQHEATINNLRQDLMHSTNERNTLHTALTEANNQRNELRSQLVAAQRAADANPLYMSAMERDHLLVQLDEMLKNAANTNRVNAVTLIRKHAVPMRLLSVQPTLAECGNLMRAMLYMYYGGHQETAFNEEDKTRARKLHAFINAAKA